MTQADKLTYCKYCTQSVFDNSQGLICSFTKKKANFTKRCEQFEKDIEELKKSQRGSGAYRMTSDESTQYIFPYISEKDRQTINLSSLSLFKRVFKSWEFYTLCLVTVSVFTLVISNLNVPIEYTGTTTALVFIAVLLSLNKRFKQKPHLVIDKDGLRLHNSSVIKWKDVIRYYFSSFIDVNNNNPLLSRTTQTLIIEKFGKAKNIRIDITPCGQNLSLLGKKIEVIKAENKNLH
ncbi:hypothetical protein L3073_11110 [Ancylomarina sp. DW003]|nr:hypothetical protein [Ancylomarina sp. DW003]MDE5422757.1 hypothetical protein [Ancylomarina sp. DW003]